MGDSKFVIFISIILGFIAILYISDFTRTVYDYKNGGLSWKESFKKAIEYYFYTE